MFIGYVSKSFYVSMQEIVSKKIVLGTKSRNTKSRTQNIENQNLELRNIGQGNRDFLFRDDEFI